MENKTGGRKTLQELTFKDNFMFAAVMMDEDNAKGVLERTLGIEIGHVEVSYEKSIVYNPEYRGVRLDVYIKDTNNTHFNVEMQVVNESIQKRARYYHSQIDMELLLTGEEYEALPETYVIFICDFDPIGLKKYKYTIRQKVAEDMSYEYNDGTHTVFLSTFGQNDNEVSKSLVQFLKFVKAELKESQNDFEDEFVQRLQKSVNQIKRNREMGRRYMLFEEICRKEFNAGKEEGIQQGQQELAIETILQFISKHTTQTDELKAKLASISSTEKLKQLIPVAATAQSLDEFLKTIDENN